MDESLHKMLTVLKKKYPKINDETTIKRLPVGVKRVDNGLESNDCEAFICNGKVINTGYLENNNILYLSS